MKFDAEADNREKGIKIFFPFSLIRVGYNEWGKRREERYISGGIVDRRQKLTI